MPVDLIDLIHEGIGREKYHVIAVPVLHDFMNIAGNIVVLLPGSAGELAGHIPGDQYGALLGIEHRVRVYFIVFLLSPQQILVILDRQKRGGKQDRTASPEHAFLQIFSGIDAEQLQFKAPVLTRSRIFDVVFIDPLVNIQKMAELEIEIQQILPHLQTDLLLLLQIIADNAVKSGQRLHQHVNILHQPVSVAVPFHGQQLRIALFQQLADPLRIAFPHKGTLSVRLSSLMSFDIDRVRTVHFHKCMLLWQLF